MGRVWVMSWESQWFHFDQTDRPPPASGGSTNGERRGLAQNLSMASGNGEPRFSTGGFELLDPSGATVR